MFQRRTRARHRPSDSLSASCGNGDYDVEATRRIPRSSSRSLSPERPIPQQPYEQDHMRRAFSDEDSSSLVRLYAMTTNNSNDSDDKGVIFRPKMPLKEHASERSGALTEDSNSTAAAEKDDGETSTSSSTGSADDDDDDDDGMSVRPEDMKYRLTSTLLFLTGACIQTVTAVWDLQSARTDAAWDADHKNDNNANDDNSDDKYANLYRVLYTMGPLLYLVNALVDMIHSLTLPRDHPHYGGDANNHSNPQTPERFYILKRCWKMWINSMLPRRPHQPITATHDNDHNEEQQQDQDYQEFDPVVEEKLWEFASAAVFGIGALLEVYATFVDYDQDPKDIIVTGGNVNVVAMHTYLISGLVTVNKERRLLNFRPGGSVVRILMGLGVTLFLLGSLLDCVVSYLYDPLLVSDELISPVTLAWCNLSSAICWNIDAIIIIVADWIVFDVSAKIHHYWMQPRPPRQRRIRFGRGVELAGTSLLTVPLMVALNPTRSSLNNNNAMDHPSRYTW